MSSREHQGRATVAAQTQHHLLATLRAALDPDPLLLCEVTAKDGVPSVRVVNKDTAELAPQEVQDVASAALARWWAPFAAAGWRIAQIQWSTPLHRQNWSGIAVTSPAPLPRLTEALHDSPDSTVEHYIVAMNVDGASCISSRHRRDLMNVNVIKPCGTHRMNSRLPPRLQRLLRDTVDSLQQLFRQDACYKGPQDGGLCRLLLHVPRPSAHDRARLAAERATARKRRRPERT